MTFDEPLHATVISPDQAAGLDRQAETARLGDAIAELASGIQAATYQLLVLIHQFDEQEGWGEGFNSCAHWLNWRTGLAMGAAREKVRVARALAELPQLSAAMHRGVLSYSKARALTRIATPENETSLADFARCATAAHVERLVRAWRRVDRIDAAEDEQRRHATRHLDTWVDEDGMLVIRGRLSPEVGAVVQRALEAATERLYQETDDAESTSPDSPAGHLDVSAVQRRADAIGLLAEAALSAALDGGSAGDRYQVVVHVDEGVLRDDDGSGQSALEDPDGQYVPAGTSRRIACDAATVVMRHNRDGRVVDVGRKTRTISPAIRRALIARDHRCRFPGCNCRHCDAHHGRHWADGGMTRLDNLVMLCRRHHRAVHEEGFGVELRGNGDAHFFWPDGRPFPNAPPAPNWTDAPLAPTNRSLSAAGITIGAETATPDWYGERLDLPWAIQVLRPPPPSIRVGCDVPAETHSGNSPEATTVGPL